MENILSNISAYGISDPFSSLSHLVAAIVFLLLGILLIKKAKGSTNRQLILGLYVFSVVFLLSMSGVYHLLETGTARLVLQRLDHAAIFILIAGTFTALHGILFRGKWRWGMLLVIWAIAIAGILFKTIFFEDFPAWLGYMLYLGMGWLGAISGLLLHRRFGFQFIRWLIYGALAYTFGAILDALKFPIIAQGLIGPHEIFHIAVLFGIGYHWAFISHFSGDFDTSPVRIHSE